MSVELGTLTAAVVTSLNSPATGEFSQRFTASRKYVVSLAPDELGTIYNVFVWPQTIASRFLTRGGAQLQRLPVHVVVVKSFDTDPDDLDPIARLVREIADHFNPGNFGTTGAKLMGENAVSVSDPIFDLDLLKLQQVALASILLDFTA